VLPAPTAAASLSHPADAAAPYRSAGTAVLSHLADAAALPLALVEAGRRVVLVDAPPAAFRVRTDLDLLAARALLGETLPAPAGRTPGGVSPRDEGSTAR
jgi:hypothetical protein